MLQSISIEYFLSFISYTFTEQITLKTNDMKILKVELDETDQNIIFSKLISNFRSDTEKEQEIEFEYNSMTIGAKLTLTIEGTELDENHQGIESKYVSNFEIWVMIDGEEVDYTLSTVSFYNEIMNRYQTRQATSFMERIEKHYKS